MKATAVQQLDFWLLRQDEDYRHLDYYHSSVLIISPFFGRHYSVRCYALWVVWHGHIILVMEQV